MDTCELCHSNVADDDSIVLDGVRVCSLCKPGALAAFQERGEVLAGSWGRLSRAELGAIRSAHGILVFFSVVLGFIATFMMIPLLDGRVGLDLGFAGLGFVGVILVSLFGVLWRPEWARVFGMTICYLGLVGSSVMAIVWIATDGGIAWVSDFGVLFSLVVYAVILTLSWLGVTALREKALFGPDRIRPKEIRVEWMVRSRKSGSRERDD